MATKMYCTMEMKITLPGRISAADIDQAIKAALERLGLAGTEVAQAIRPTDTQATLRPGQALWECNHLWLFQIELEPKASELE